MGRILLDVLSRLAENRRGRLAHDVVLERCVDQVDAGLLEDTLHLLLETASTKSLKSPVLSCFLSCRRTTFS